MMDGTPRLDARAALRAALAAQEAARARAQQAADVAERALALHNEASEKVRACAHNERKIASERIERIADRIRAWATSGGARPGTESPDLTAARATLDAQAEEDAARSAHDALASEHKAAQKDAKDADAAVAAAAEAVLIEEAEILADALAAADATARKLRDQLHGLGRVWLPQSGKSRPVPLSSRIGAILDGGPPQLPISADPVGEATARWRRYHTALLSDPNATLEDNLS